MMRDSHTIRTYVYYDNARYKFLIARENITRWNMTRKAAHNLWLHLLPYGLIANLACLLLGVHTTTRIQPQALLLN